MTLRAGVAKSDITIDDPTVPVHDPLYAKVLVLDNGATRVAIIAMDVVAIGHIFDVSDDFLPELRARVEAELGMPGANLLVNASHTHPPRRMLCPHAEQVARTFDAVRRATEDMVEVRVGVGSGHENRFVINRTLRLKNGKGWTIRQANPCPPDEEVAGLGPVDAQIGILRVDRLDGRPLAVVYNYACHPLIGMPGGPVTANFPGFASEVIEDCLGEGALALFVQGAGGDMTEVLYKAFGQPRDSQPLGAMLGQSTIKALAGIATGGDTRLQVVSETIRLPRRQDIPERIAELEAEREGLLNSMVGMALNFRAFLPLYLQYSLNPEWPADYSYRYLQAEARGSNEISALDELNRHNIAKYLANIRAMERIARIQSNIGTLRHHQALNEAAGEDTIAAEVMGLRIGACVFITAPIEVLTQVGLNVKAASPHEHTFMAAFSNGYMHYGPPADEYPMGGYEVTECLLAPGWQALYEEAAQRVLAQL